MTALLSLVQQKGVYAVAEEGGSVDIHLYDPVVDFSPLWKTAALNNGTGYQLRQAIKTPEGEWSGNLAADLYVSSVGSNYLRNFRNMFDSSWSCRANSPGGNVLRLTEIFPKYGSPKPGVFRQNQKPYPGHCRCGRRLYPNRFRHHIPH